MFNSTSVDNVTREEKIFSVLAYLGLWWFGMLPTRHRESQFLKNHVNNGITLYALCLIPCVGIIASIVFAVMGIISVLKNKYFDIPLISSYSFLKFYW